MKINKIFLFSIWFFVILSAFFLFNWRTANVISPLPIEEIFVGDKLTGEIYIDLEDANEESIFILSILDEKDNILDVKTSKFAKSMIRDQKYLVNLSMMEYTFNEKGKYEINLILLDEDRIFKKEMLVK